MFKAQPNQEYWLLDIYNIDYKYIYWNIEWLFGMIEYHGKQQQKTIVN